jgi:hypothetical protein
VRIDRGEWRNSAADNRSGRLIVVPMAWACDITDEPFTIVPFAVPGIPGSSVQVDLTVAMLWPDGSSTTSGIIQLPQLPSSS